MKLLAISSQILNNSHSCNAKISNSLILDHNNYLIYLKLNNKNSIIETINLTLGYAAFRVLAGKELETINMYEKR